MANVQVTTMVKPVSTTVRRRRSPISGLIGWSSARVLAPPAKLPANDRPRSPCINPQIHFPYCTMSGWSIPRYLRIAAVRSSPAGPDRLSCIRASKYSSTRSPAGSCMMNHARSDIAHTVKPASISLLAIYASMGIQATLSDAAAPSARLRKAASSFAHSSRFGGVESA